MNTSKLFAVGCIALAVSGCATKRYGRLQPVSGAESSFYSCREIELEMAKVESFRNQVSDGAKVNFASVAGFLGDWGIGNSMEKNAAEKSANERMVQLSGLKAAKGCGYRAAPSPEAYAPVAADAGPSTPSAASPSPPAQQDRRVIAPGIICTTC